MNQLKINDEIKSKQIRLITNNSSEIYNLTDALNLAQKLNLDLVEINSNANPPVCKIVDYKKYLYQQKKKEKENKAKQVRIETKEIRLSYNIGDNDLATKEKQAIKFLSKGNRILISMFFKGRTIVFIEQGKLKINQFISDLGDYCTIEKDIAVDGKKITCFIKAKK